MSNHFRGVFPEHMCKAIDMLIETNKAINDLLPMVIEEMLESEDDSVPRSIFDREYSGHEYVLDVLAGHQEHSYNCFRLPTEAFVQIHNLLVERGLLSDTGNITAAEQLGIFLRGVTHAHNYSQLCEFFQHSLETVTHYFKRVLRVILSLSKEFINLPSVDCECHAYIRGNEQFHPFFKDALGVIDGTHIPAIVDSRSQGRYRNGKGFTSQNVLAAVSFDRQFIYVASGWEGSAEDMRVLHWATNQGYFCVPQGKYYLADSGYVNTNKFLTPFRGFRYHLSDYRGGTNHSYKVPQELYNHRHAQLRNVVERTFGIWKERFKVLTRMRQFPVKVQGDIVIACAILHNFIGRHHDYDHYFNMSQTEIEHDREFGEVSTCDDDDDDDPFIDPTFGEKVKGDVLRHAIAKNMWEERERGLRRRSV